MKEVTLVATIQVTEIQKLSDEQFNQLFKRVDETNKKRSLFTKNIIDEIFENDDVTVKTQTFVRDIDD